MYAPKNIIKKGNYANNGEFIELKTRKPYSGPYVSLFDTLFFSGVILSPLSKRLIRSKSPQLSNLDTDKKAFDNIINEINNNLITLTNNLGSLSTPVIEYIKGKNPIKPDLSSFDENTILLINDTKELNESLYLYSIYFSKRIIYDSLVTKEITDIKNYKNINSFIPRPNEKDYLKGYINRFFIKKINETYGPIIEVSSSTYNKLINKSSDYNYSIYKTLKIRWKITKSPQLIEDIKFQNYKTVQLHIKHMHGLGIHLKNLTNFSLLQPN